MGVELGDPGQSGPDHLRGEVVGSHVLERSLVRAPDRRTRRGNDDGFRHGKASLRVVVAAQKPSSRPMRSFMISLQPPQISVMRASLHARATRYSFMNPYPPWSWTQLSSTSFWISADHHFAFASSLALSSPRRSE